MDDFVITPDVPLADCLAAGYPDPENRGGDWIDFVRARVAERVECEGLDLDEATAIIEVAFARTRFTTPYLQRLLLERMLPQ